MNAVSLQHYLTRLPSLSAVIFPRDEERVINVEDFKHSIDFDDEVSSSENVAAAGFFMQYIDDIASRKEGMAVKELVLEQVVVQWVQLW